MNRPEIHPFWRVALIHLLAKLLGVLVHVDGLPFGSARIYRASPEGRVSTGPGKAFYFGPRETKCSSDDR